MKQKFAQLLMGLLGMKTGTKQKATGSAGSEILSSTVQNKTKSANQVAEQNSSQQDKEQDAPKGLFVGAHFISLNKMMHAETAEVEDTGKKTAPLSVSEGIQPENMPVGDLPLSGLNVTASADNTQLQQAKDRMQNGVAKPANMVTEKGFEQASYVNFDTQPGATKKTETSQSASKKLLLRAVQQLQLNGGNYAPEASLKEAVKRVQQIVQNTPGVSIANIGSKEIAGILKEQLAAVKSGANSSANLREVLAGNPTAKQMQSAKIQQSPSLTSADGQTVFSSKNQQSALQMSTGEQKLSKHSSQSAGDQKHPALRHLLKTKGVDRKVKINLPGMSSPDQADKSTNQPSVSGKSMTTSTNITQSLAASESGKTLFKPLQQDATVLKLDPSKLMKVEGKGSGDVEMELQAQADKDASAGEEGKSTIKFKGTNVNQLSKAGGRREFSAQLVRYLKQQAGSGKSGAAKNWSHHRFVMDDGKALNVSVRQAEGAMQLQLSAGSSELNKVIQQHIDEIRQHLQEQMSVDIDLQLQHFEDPKTGQGNEGKQNAQSGSGFDHNGMETGTDEESASRTVRYLGFNNNEWTA